MQGFPPTWTAVRTRSRPTLRASGSGTAELVPHWCRGRLSATPSLQRAGQRGAPPARAPRALPGPDTSASTLAFGVPSPRRRQSVLCGQQRADRGGPGQVWSQRLQRCRAGCPEDLQPILLVTASCYTVSRTGIATAATSPTTTCTSGAVVARFANTPMITPTSTAGTPNHSRRLRKWRTRIPFRSMPGDLASDIAVRVWDVTAQAHCRSVLQAFPAWKCAETGHGRSTLEPPRRTTGHLMHMRMG